MHPNEALLLQPELAEQIAEIKEHYKAVNPEAQILGLARDALDKSNIKESIIVLQTADDDNSYTVTESDPDQKYFVLSMQYTFAQIEAIIYHECGHLFYNHQSPTTDYKDKVATSSAFLPFMVTPLMTSFKEWKASLLKKIGLSATLGAIMVIASSTGLHVWERNTNQFEEWQADEFMYEMLLEQHKVVPVLEKISDNIEEHEDDDDTWLDSWFSTHPTYLNRAAQGIAILKKYGYSIKAIIENLPSDMDDRIKELFPEQIKKWFPEELKI